MVALILCATVIIQTKATPLQREHEFEPMEGELYEEDSDSNSIEDDSDSIEDVLQEFSLDSDDKSRMYGYSESPMDVYGYGESRMDGYDEYPNGYDACIPTCQGHSYSVTLTEALKNLLRTNLS